MMSSERRGRYEATDRQETQSLGLPPDGEREEGLVRRGRKEEKRSAGGGEIRRRAARRWCRLD